MEFYNEGYSAIVELLTRDGYCPDGYAVRRTCHELARMVVWRRSVRVQLIEDDILRKLFPMIDAIVEINADVVVDVGRLIRRLISLKEPTELDIQSRITEAGYLQLFQKALESHPSDPDVFKEVCRVLILLCFDMPHAPHADNQVDAVESGLASRIVGTLAESPSASADEAALACEALFSLVYENEITATQVVEDCGAIQILKDLLTRHPTSEAIVSAVARTLFQLITLLPHLKDEIIERHFFERMLDIVELNRNSYNPLHLWHVLKFAEIGLRSNEAAKDEFCRYQGPIIFIQAVHHVRAGPRGQTQLLGCLYYVMCMMLCRIALGGQSLDPPTSVSVSRIGHLVQSAAHQFALEVLKIIASSNVHVAEQAVRLLLLIASVEANRIPLTRLGASRQVKVVYNNTNHPGLLSLCERAVAAIEGT